MSTNVGFMDFYAQLLGLALLVLFLNLIPFLRMKKYIFSTLPLDVEKYIFSYAESVNDTLAFVWSNTFFYVLR